MEKMKKDGTPAKKPGRKPKTKAQDQIPEVKLTGPIKIVTPEPEAVEIKTPESGSMADAMKGMKDAAEEFFGACEDMGLTLNTKIECQDDTYTGEPEKKPTVRARLKPTAVFHPEMGEFYFDRKYKLLDWRTIEGEEVSMSPKMWLQLAEDLPDIMEVLGVDPE